MTSTNKTLPKTASEIRLLIRKTEGECSLVNVGVVAGLFVVFSFYFARDWWIDTTEMLLPFYGSPILVAGIVIGTMSFCLVKLSRLRDKKTEIKAAAQAKLKKFK